MTSPDPQNINDEAFKRLGAYMTIDDIDDLVKATQNNVWNNELRKRIDFDRAKARAARDVAVAESIQKEEKQTGEKGQVVIKDEGNEGEGKVGGVLGCRSQTYSRGGNEKSGTQ